MILALIPFLLLLLGAGLIPIVARKGPQFVAQTAVSVSGVTLLIWLVARTQSPFTVTIGNWADGELFSSFAWQVDLVNWKVVAALLLLLFVASLSKVNRPKEEVEPFAYLFFLTAVSYTAICAANLMSMIIGIALLMLPWLFAIWQQMTTDYGRLLRYMMMICGAIGLIWYGMAITPVIPGWPLQNMPPTNAVTAVAFAGALLVGIWPFYGWRLRIQDVPNEVALFGFIIPTAIGGVLFARFVNSTLINPNIQLLLSLFAFLGLLHAIRLAWSHLDTPRMIAMAILFAQAQLVLLSGIWVNGIAVTAELPVLILAGGILFLAPEEPIRRERAWQAVAPMIALASFVALPLTTGFVGRAALYSVWLENGRFLFVIVLAILTIPLATAMILRFWPKMSATEADPITNRELQELTIPAISRDGGILLLAIAFISVFGIGWSLVHPLAYIMIFLSFIVGLVLLRFIEEAQQVQDVFQQAFSVGAAIPSERLQAIGDDLGTAVRDAAKILEGEGGLVWLFILAVLFFLLS